MEELTPNGAAFMAGKNFAFKVKANEIGEDTSEITLENAPFLTIYQLRQELTRRGIFDEIFGANGEKRHINTEACLQVLISELVREKSESEARHLAELEAARVPEGETLKEKLAREKLERKKAALERSAKRQEEKEYFEMRRKANEEAKVKADAKIKTDSSSIQKEVPSNTKTGRGPEESSEGGIHVA